MSEKMREEFEVWASQFFKMDVEQWGEYVDGETQWAWLSWQASRAALVVELPSDINGEYYADGWNAALMCVEGILEEAGASYK